MQPAAVEHEVTSGMMRRIVDQHQVGLVVAGNESRQRFGKPAEIKFAVNVAIDHGEYLALDQGKRGGDSARGFQRTDFARILDRHAERGAVPQRILDLLAEMGMVDDDMVEPSRTQALDMPAEQRLAVDRLHRLE